MIPPLPSTEAHASDHVALSSTGNRDHFKSASRPDALHTLRAIYLWFRCSAFFSLSFFWFRLCRAARYRGLLGCWRRDSVRESADCKSAIQQIENLRYGYVLQWLWQGAVAVAVGMTQLALHAAGSWPEALARMPLASPVRELNRTNCVEVMLHAFGSNDLVKALILMPGATDEFYLFRRAKAELTNASPTLLDAVTALTNQTNIRISFRPPFLLLHTDEDPTEPDEIVRDQKTAERLAKTSLVLHLVCDDRDWDYLQPLLKRWLRIQLRPWRYSTDSWHFYRHSFAAWNLNGLEALECAALAGKTKFIIRHKEVVFDVDPCVKKKPTFDIHLH